MTPQQFISAIATSAQANERVSKVPASFTIAQAALESGWGARALGNNLFGIKADASWHGATVTMNTHEVVHGVRVPVVAQFRAYPDWQGSIDDHSKFLTGNPRYHAAFACLDSHAFTCAIAVAGYATDENYASIINSIIDTHNLTEYDVC